MGKVKLNLAGFREVRHAPGVVAELERRAEAIADAANATIEGAPDGGENPPDEHYGTDSQPGKNRHRTSVVTKSAHAMNSNARNNTLLKLLGDGDG